jgi:hypothetical protein
MRFRRARRCIFAHRSPLLSKRVHPLVSFRSPAECYRSVPAPLLQRVKTPSWGFPPSSRHQPTASTSAGIPAPATFRPRRFTRPRRFAPPPALRACFIPQPRPGFRSSGVSPSVKPYRLVDGQYPRVVGHVPLSPGCPADATERTSPSGLALHRDPLRRRRCLAADFARSPPELLLLQVLSPPRRGVAFTTSPLMAFTARPSRRPCD